MQATRIRGRTNGHSNQFSQMLSREVAPIPCAGESSNNLGKCVAVPSPALKWQAAPPVTCWRLANHPGWAGEKWNGALTLCTFLTDLRPIRVASCRTAERILSSASRLQRRTPWLRPSGRAVIAGRPGPAAVRSQAFLFRRKF